jgi:hypothetical protein
MNPHLHTEMMRAHSADLDRKAAAHRIAGEPAKRESLVSRVRGYRLRRTYDLRVPRPA